MEEAHFHLELLEPHLALVEEEGAVLQMIHSEEVVVEEEEVPKLHSAKEAEVEEAVLQYPWVALQEVPEAEEQLAKRTGLDGTE